MSFGNKFFTAKSLSLACFTCMELLDVFKHSNDVEWKLDCFVFYIQKNVQFSCSLICYFLVNVNMLYILLKICQSLHFDMNYLDMMHFSDDYANSFYCCIEYKGNKKTNFNPLN